MGGMGTSTNCSTTCGSGSEERGGAWHIKSQGTLVAFPAFPPGEWSRIFSTSTTESTICGSEVCRRGTTGTQSTICSTVRRKTRSCGPDTADSRSGRDPAASTSSTSREKYSVPAAWGVGCSGTLPCSTAIVGLRRAEWCVYAARAMRTVCCS